MLTDKELEDIKYRNERQRQVIESGQFTASVYVRPEDVERLLEDCYEMRAIKKFMDDNSELFDELAKTEKK